MRFIRCGKPTCHCASGDGHGPYWYGYRHRQGRLETRYFGQRPVDAAFDEPSSNDRPQETQPETPRVEDDVAARWTYTGRMTKRTALRIFALAEKPDDAMLRNRYRQLLHQHHPDHGGDARVTAAIIAAYQHLRRIRRR